MNLPAEFRNFEGKKKDYFNSTELIQYQPQNRNSQLESSLIFDNIPILVKRKKSLLLTLPDLEKNEIISTSKITGLKFQKIFPIYLLINFVGKTVIASNENKSVHSLKIKESKQNLSKKERKKLKEEKKKMNEMKPKILDLNRTPSISLLYPSILINYFVFVLFRRYSWNLDFQSY
jgi:hypothetical protein